MSKKPRVSFVCAVRDGEGDVERCSMSVLRQTMSEVELILVDDHSSDGTLSKMAAIAKSDPRVRVVRNQGLAGLTYSLNAGLDFAKGDYVARIDVDDFAHSDRAEKQVGLIESRPGTVMAACGYRLVDREDWLLYSHCPPSDPKMLRWSLCFRNYIRHSTAMWLRSLSLRYDPSFPYAQDYELWCRISREGEIAVLAEQVVTIRSRTDSITSTRHEEQESAADRVAAGQYQHYTGIDMGRVEARNLRMVQHMKSSEQFRVFDSMAEVAFERAVADYCRLATAFEDKEKPERETFMREVGNDVISLLNNPSRRESTIRAITSFDEDQFGTIAEIKRRFVNS